MAELASEEESSIYELGDTRPVQAKASQVWLWITGSVGVLLLGALTVAMVYLVVVVPRLKSLPQLMQSPANERGAFIGEIGSSPTLSPGPESTATPTPETLMISTQEAAPTAESVRQMPPVATDTQESVAPEPAAETLAGVVEMAGTATLTSETLAPTEASEPTETLAPTETPVPTETLAPTETSTPTETLAPTEVSASTELFTPTMAPLASDLASEAQEAVTRLPETGIASRFPLGRMVVAALLLGVFLAANRLRFLIQKDRQ